MSAGTQDPREGMGSQFICHLQASRQADLPQGEEENIWGEGGHGGQKLAAWNLPFLQFSGGGPLASLWPVLWMKQAGGREYQPCSTGHQKVSTLRRALVCGGARLGDTWATDRGASPDLRSRAVATGEGCVQRLRPLRGRCCHQPSSPCREAGGTSTRQRGGGRRAGLEGKWWGVVQRVRWWVGGFSEGDRQEEAGPPVES